MSRIFINKVGFLTTMDFQNRRKHLLEQTQLRLQDAVNEDLAILQSLATIDDLTTQLNHLSGRLREWAGYIFPETEYEIQDHEQFARLLANNDQNTVRGKRTLSMGRNLDEADWPVLQGLAKHITSLYDYKFQLLSYLETVLQEHSPNLHALLGTPITARLIAAAGSRKRLASMPASTVQLLGAEKALFRHLKSGARSPKHGYIVNHQLISKGKKQEAGKIARALGDKAAICAKLDYFKGDFYGEKYLQELRKKFS